jgi:hypothetical protein
MFAFLIGKQNLINEESNKNQAQIYNKRLEATEVKLHNKYEKINNFNPEECFDSDVSDNESKKSVQSHTPEEKPHSKSFDATVFSSPQKQKTKKLERISLFKKLSSLIEFLVSILIVASAIISLVENEKYYNYNYDKRVISVLMINSFRNNRLGATNYTKVFDGISLGKILRNNSTITNKEVLNMLNIDDDFTDFNLNAETKSYKEITVPMEIPSECTSLRLTLLIISVLASKLIFNFK